MKICLVLLRTFGDVILGNTLVDNLKLKYPDAEITYLVEDKYKELVQYNPNVKEVRCPKSWDEVLFTLAHEQWDKVCMAHQTSYVDNMWHHCEPYRRGHLIDFYAYRIGLELETLKRDIVFYPNPNAQPMQLQPNALAIHTTTLVPSKNWNKFNDMMPYLTTKGYKVYQFGMPTDMPVVGAEDLRGKLTPSEIFQTLKQCEYFIGLDSGLSYLATAAGCKVTCIMGPTIPITSGPYGENVRKIVSPTRPECQAQRCHGNCRYNASCISNVTVETVMEKL